MSFLKVAVRFGCAIAAITLATAPAAAQSTEEIGVELLQLLVDEGLIPLEKAQNLLDRARRNAEARTQREATATASTTIDVPYVPEAVRNQIRDEVKAEVVAQAKAERWIAPGTLPGWLDGVKLSGDFRMRYQSTMFADGNFPAFPDVNAILQAGGVSRTDFPLLNTTDNFHQLRYRARLGVEAQISDKVKLGFRLASGEDNGPIATNDIIGDNFRKDAIYIDRAYLELKPIKQATLIAGRMPNPFYSTDLVWDVDVNMEGLAGQLSHDFGDDLLGARLFATGGYFPLQEKETDGIERYLLAGQGGVSIRPVDDLELQFAGAYYDFKNLQGRRNAPDGARINDHTAPMALARGNSLFDIRTDGLTSLPGLASRFELLNFTGHVAYRGFGDIGVKLTGDYVVNLGFDQSEIAALRVGEPGSVPPDNNGYQIRLDVGHDEIRKFGDWQFAAAYKRVDTDAVVDIFTHSEFGLGGTDVKGYLIRGRLGLLPNTYIGANWYSTKSISSAPLDVDVLQIDLGARF